MTVLVTGGAGYIGSHAAYALIDAGYSVVVLDNLTTGHRSLVPEAATFIEGSVADQELVSELIEAHKIQAVMHFAGSVIVEESVRNPEKYFANNTEASKALIDVCVDRGVKYFIFSSTAAVYGDVAAEKVDEEARPHPATPYAESKLRVEQYLQAKCTDAAMKYTVLRYFNVAGADPQGRTGQVVDGATHLIKVACEVATGKREKLTIYGADYDTPDGTAIRDFIHVSDLVDMHVCVLRAFEKKTLASGQVFNCGYGKGTSVRQVVEGLNGLLDAPLVVVDGPRREGDLQAVVADCTKFAKTFEWKPKFNDLGAILNSTLTWERNVHDW